MTTRADRISGVIFAAFGLVLYFLIIPRFVETVRSGSLTPDAIPNFTAIVIILGGVFMAVRPSQQAMPDMKALVKSGLYFGILGLGLYAISQFGFVYVAPVLGAIIMVLIGERRPVWLVAGIVGVPAVIWFVVERVLERGLP